MSFKMIIFFLLYSVQDGKRKNHKVEEEGKGKRPGKDGNKISDAGRQVPRLFQHIVSCMGQRSIFIYQIC